MTSRADASSASGRRRRSRGRRLLVQLGAVVVFFVAAEGGLRLAGLAPAATDDPYVTFAGERLFVPDPDAPDQLVTASAKRNHFNPQRFAATKPPGSFRIVCLGGSTTYGRPYADSTSFAGWLRELLPAADPDTPWEVINAGGVSYASYRVAALLEELLDVAPDLLIVYTGHNEFLEERTYASRGAARFLPGWITGSALFGLARRVTGAAGDDDAERFELGDEVQTLLDGSLGPEAYTRDDALASDIVGHLRHNLSRMAAAAREADVPLVLITPASQLADCRPFKSEPSVGLAPEAARDVAATLTGWPDDRVAQAACREALERAATLDPRQALVWYRLGQARAAAGDLAGARAAYARARDEDIVPLRATTAIVETIRSVATEEGVPLLDAVELLDRLADERTGAPIPGRELFLDHVHMTIEAYRELALALLPTLEGMGLVTRAASFDAEAIAEISQRVEGQLDTEDQLRALVRLANVLDWAGKRDEAERLNAQALELSGRGDAMSLWMEANHARDRGQLEVAVDGYRAALAIDPEYAEAHHNLGSTLLLLNRPAEALPHGAAAARLLPECAASHLVHGRALDGLGRRGEARAELARARELDPENTDIHNALGLSYTADRMLDDAERSFRYGIRADPGSARSHFNLGVLLLALRRDAEATAALVQATTLDPTHAGAHARLGEAFLRQGLIDESVAAYQRALALDPESQRTQAGLAEARASLTLGGDG